MINVLCFLSKSSEYMLFSCILVYSHCTCSKRGESPSQIFVRQAMMMMSLQCITWLDLRIGSTKSMYLIPDRYHFSDTGLIPFLWLKGQATGSWQYFPMLSYSSFLLPCKLILLLLPWRAKLLWCGWRVESPLHWTPERPWMVMWCTQTMNSVMTFVVWIQYLAQSYSFSPIFLLSSALFLGRSYWNQWTTLWREEPFFGVCKTALVEITEMSSKQYFWEKWAVLLRELSFPLPLESEY